MALATLELPGTLSKLSSAEDSVGRQCTEIVNSLRREFADRNSLYADIDAVVFGDLPVWIPDAYRKTALEVHSPLAIHIINTVTAALSVNPVTYQFRPTGFGDAATENATQRERFFEASWERQMEESRRRLDRLFTASLVTKGEGILKTVERSKRAWATYDYKSKRLQQALESDPSYKGFDQHARDHLYDRQTEEYKLQLPYPIATTDVPPETFVYEKNEDGLTFAAEVKQVPYLEALARYGANIDGKGRILSKEQLDPRAMGLAQPERLWDSRSSTRQRSITMIEGYDWEWCTCILVGPGQQSSTTANLGNGTVVKRFKHGLGDPILKTLKGPYFHALGITTASRMPHRAGLGVLFGFLRLFPLLDSLVTSQGNAGFMTGFPAFKRTLPPGTLPGLSAVGPFGNDGTEGEARAERIEPGTVYPFDIAPIDQPRSGAEMDKTIGMVRQFIELALPTIVQGVVSGDESGYALNQAQHLARLAWDPIVSNAETAHGERCGHEAWLIKNRIGEKVYAWGDAPQKRRGSVVVRGRTAAGWLGIGPDDLDNPRSPKARLDPQTPSNEIIETRAVTEQMTQRLITREDAIERLGNNPDEVERSWLLYEMKNDPLIRQKLRDRTFQKIGIMDTQAVQGPPGSPDVSDPMAGATGGPAPGGPGGGGPEVYQPGQNGVPLTPTPAGARTGFGPAGRALAGAPVQPNLPANHLPLPGGP